MWPPARRAVRSARGMAELAPVAVGLFEVVAEDLVPLDQDGAVLLEPVGEALVQLRPDRLGQRVVGGVADQQVAEAEAVLAGEQRRSGRISSLRTSAASRGVTCARPVRGPARRRGGRARPRRRPARARPARRLELVEPGREQRLQRRRAPPPRRRPPAPSRPSRSRNSGLPPAAWAIRSRNPPATRARRSAASTSWRRAGRAAARPAIRRRRSTSSGRARQSSSSGAPAESSATCSIRSRNVSSPHWMSSNTTTQRRRLLEQLPERPGDLLRRGRRVVLPEQ